MKTLQRYVRAAAVLYAVVLLLILAARAAAQAWDRQDSVVANPTDVTVVSPGGAVSHPNSSTPPDTPLHDGSGGALLGVTWGQWQAAQADSRIRCDSSGSTDVRVSLTGLIPNAVYSVFYRTFGPDSYNLLCPSEERSRVVLTCLTNNCKQEVLDSHLMTDATGQASVLGHLPGVCLLTATQAFFEVDYHFDGQSYGQLPNKGEFQTQLRPCQADADCASGDECQPTGFGFACQPPSCRTDSTTCRVCTGSFGRDTYRQLEITQK